MLVLGIESSCDETAVAVVEDGTKVLSNIIATQYEVHTKYGGVVPELASRRHTENIMVSISEALASAGKTLKDIDIFAATRGPGLLGALLVGLSTAKGLAWSEQKPLIPVHHIHGHILAAGLTQEISYPFLSLVVSGGHTSLFKIDSPVSIKEISSTRDDAAGEAFDKVAKLLGLGFPGGPAVEKEASRGDKTKYHFKIPVVKGKPLHFSFSGLKTAARNLIHKTDDIEKERANIAASFQEAAVNTLASKTFKAAEEYQLDKIVLAGGVACNKALRETMQEIAKEKSISVSWPEPVYCTDNGAMIASAAYYIYQQNPDNKEFTNFKSMDAVANLPLT